MRRGFTILELLVAALLLGMLVTVLTMIFNQSSIAWRTGVAGLLDMDEVRDKVAAVRDEADSIYIWNKEIHYTLSIWKEDETGPELRKRAIDSDTDVEARTRYLEREGGLNRDNLDSKDAFGPVDVSRSKSEPGKNWIVNVKSFGPNRTTKSDRMGDYDDIFSMPDDFD